MKLSDIIKDIDNENLEIEIQINRFYDFELDVPIDSFVESDKNITYKYHEACALCEKHTDKLNKYFKVILCDDCYNLFK